MAEQPIDPSDVRAQSPERVRVVEWKEFRRLVVSTRRLEWHRGKRGVLHDLETEELFALEDPSDERLAQGA